MNAAISLGLSRADVMDMSWGQLVLMLQANAQSYKDEPEEATFEQIKAAFGV